MLGRQRSTPSQLHRLFTGAPGRLLWVTATLKALAAKAPNHGLFAFDAALSPSSTLPSASDAGFSLCHATILVTDTNFTPSDTPLSALRCPVYPSGAASIGMFEAAQASGHAAQAFGHAA